MRGTRWEIITTGFDENLQIVGSDPYHSPYYTGLRIPAARLAKNKRYLFLLDLARFGAGRTGRLTGIRQLLTMAALVNNDAQGCQYPLEKEIKSPFWHFVDGNVSWHLRRVAPLIQQTNKAKPGGGLWNSEGLQFRYGTTPALLFENAPGEPGGYTAPYGGQPPGNALVPDLATFHDLRFPWRDAEVWEELDIEISGPCDIALFASVLQTDPNTRCQLILPGSLPAGPASIPQEDAFVVNFPSSIYWRIAGSLVFNEGNLIPDDRELVKPRNIFSKAPEK